LNQIDWGAYYHFNQNPPEWLIGFASASVQLGDYPVLLLMVLAAAVVLRVHKRYRGLVFLVGCFFAALAIGEGLKLIIGRARPPSCPVPEFLGSSFPSVPAMLATVVYVGCAYLGGLVVSRYVSWLLLAVSVVFTLFLNFCLIFLGHNFVSDVVAGWLGGLALLLLAGLITEPHRDLREK
jgi:undecaprenyl-diphosphatase